jgi:hypothetical protein
MYNLEQIKQIAEATVRKGKKYEGQFLIRAINIRTANSLHIDTDFVITHIFKYPSSASVSDIASVNINIMIGGSYIFDNGDADTELFQNFYDGNGRELPYPIYIEAGDNIEIRGGNYGDVTYYFLGFIPVKEKTSLVDRSFYCYVVNFLNVARQRTYTQSVNISPKHSFVLLRIVGLMREVSGGNYVTTNLNDVAVNIKFNNREFCPDTTIDAHCLIQTPANQRDLLVPTKFAPTTPIVVEITTPNWATDTRRDIKIYLMGLKINISK